MTRTKKIGLGLAVALAAVAAALLGGVLADGSPSGRTGPASGKDPVAAAGRLLAGFAPGSTATYVRDLETKVSKDPQDGESLALLGIAYQQRARETGDPSFYPLSERALRRAMRAQDDQLLATTGLAALAASRHRFRDALALAGRAVELRPDSAAPYGILGDALVELGRYEEAFAAFDRMARLKPSIASYARISYARELLGRRKASTEAMRLAVDAGFGENAAWSLVQLGHLYFNAGRLDAAEREYERALERLPGYVYADAALARVEGVRGNFDRAVELYRGVLDTIPLPEFAIGLGDTLTAAGRRAEAREAYALVAAIRRVLAGNGVRTQLETALFDLDRNRDVAGALAGAEAAYADRRSIDAEDVLAWAYYKNRRCREALGHSEAALRLGTKDALKLFHRGMIERCLGHEEAGARFLQQALDTNPHFSLIYAPVAKEALL
jgi:tetratricopeptide (TPR) repeat protein